MRNINHLFLKVSLMIFLVLVGVLTKYYPGIGSGFVNNYLGGVIYVLFFILLANLLFPAFNHLKITLSIFFITSLVEFTQLFQNDTLTTLRSNFFVRSLIGSVFNYYDFIFYFCGALIGYCILAGLGPGKA